MTIKLLFAVTVVAMCMIAGTQPVRAQSANWTDADFAMLPEVCKVKIKFHGNAQVQKPWSDRLGVGNFIHIHHYCFGLWFEKKAALSLTKEDRIGYLRSAIGQFDYVLRHWPADSPLRPDAESRKKSAEMVLKLL